jgi:alpha-L-rhamnosidase
MSRALPKVGIVADRLRCEYLENPSGIDVTRPRLSWIVRSEFRNQRQTGYRVVVSSSEELLAQDRGDLWDSGKVESDQTIHVEYGGKPLTSRMRCFWKVQVWDAQGRESGWSETAHWSMGLLDVSSWQAEWICGGNPPPPAISRGYLSAVAVSADTVKWAAVDLGSDRVIDAIQLDPVCFNDSAGYLFPVRFKIEVARKADFSDATVVADRTGADVSNPGGEPLLYCFDQLSARHVRVTVTRLAERGREDFAFALGRVQVLSKYEGWPKARQDVAQLASVPSALDSVEADGWSVANLVFQQWVTDVCKQPATMVRKEFSVRGPVKRVVVSVTGLGLYELRINGRKVGDHILAPEYTLYTKRVQYQTYDVTDLICTGPNAVGAQLSGGWWTGPLWCMSTQNARRCLLMRMDIELADGSTQTIITDSSWRASFDGPIRRSGIYYGERYDATKEIPGWDRPGFQGTGWGPVEVLAHPDGIEQVTLVAQRNEPIRVVQEIKPVAITEPKPGVYIFDMGQNMAGWCRLMVDGPAGMKVTLRHAEVLAEDGTLYTANLRGAMQINEYILPGGKAELEPHFTYHGFRYVEVTGLASRPTLDMIVGRVIHSSAPETGTFACSNELVNKIMTCSQWGQRANMYSVATDCPQRTERMGWGGEIQSFAQASVFNRDMAAFFTKWAIDARESQGDKGEYPDLVPHPGPPNRFIHSAPAWADAGTVVPWRVYQNYADRRMPAEHFESARRWVDIVHTQNPDHLWRNGLDGNYSDWLNGDAMQIKGFPRGKGQVPKDLFATAFFAHSTQIVAKMAEVLGREGDMKKYRELFEGIKTAFNKEFVAEDGTITGDTQAGYAIALNFNLLNEAMRPQAVKHLLRAIEEYQGHPSTGLQLTHRMMLELSRSGHHDEAWRIINQRTAPSWGYMIDHGATTIWERWDGYIEGEVTAPSKVKLLKPWYDGGDGSFEGAGPWGGFQHPDMNSFNHMSFGSVGEWIWREVAGIHPDDSQPGYKHFLLRPRPAKGLTWSNARYDSIRGPITSEWKIHDGVYHLDVEIPANTTATVYVPAEGVEAVFEGDTPAVEADGVRFVHMEEGAAVFNVESGRYRFLVKTMGATHE